MIPPPQGRPLPAPGTVGVVLHRKAGSPAAGLSDDFPAEAEQPSCQLLRLRERDQVATRDHLHLGVQPLPSDAPLELEREEPVVRRRDHPYRNPRPPLELAGLPEHRIGLLR